MRIGFRQGFPSMVGDLPAESAGGHSWKWTCDSVAGQGLPIAVQAGLAIPCGYSTVTYRMLVGRWKQGKRDRQVVIELAVHEHGDVEPGFRPVPTPG